MSCSVIGMAGTMPGHDVLSSRATNFIVTDLLTFVTVNVTCTIVLARTDMAREAFPDHGARAVPARGLASRSRAALGINPLALGLEREVLSLDWDRSGRVTPA